MRKFTKAIAVISIILLFSLFTACTGTVGPQGEQGEKGEDGSDGIGILSISKTKTEGLVDTYTIVYTDGSTATFTVTNGTQGIQGIQGIQGTKGNDGHTPVITIKNGIWYIDGVNTGKKAEGVNGNDGDDGLSAFEIYQKYHPDYTGTEQDWLASLKGNDGQPGTSVISAYVDANHHLWIELSNGTKIDAGYVGFESNVPPSVTYTATFKDWDGTILKTESNIASGGSVTAPTSPSREGYTFIGWDKAFDYLTSDVIITAQYKKNITSPAVIVNHATADSDAKTVSVAISIVNNPGISSLKFDVAYDSALTLTNVVFDSAFGAYVTAPTPYENPQTVTCISPLVEISTDGTFATLTFSISDSVKTNTIANITITLYQEEIYDEDFNEVIFEVINGTVSIQKIDKLD